MRTYGVFSSMHLHIWFDDRGGLRDCHFAVYGKKDWSPLSERVLVAGVGSHCSFVFRPEACSPVESCKGHFMYCERESFQAAAASSQAVSESFIQALKQAGARPGFVRRLEEESKNLPSTWSRILRWLKERVSVDENVLAGEPTFAGSRLPLRAVGGMIHRHGQSAAKELAEDPEQEGRGDTNLLSRESEHPRKETMTDLEDLADRVLRHACPDPLCKHDSCKTEALAITCLEHIQENGLPDRDHWAIAREVLPDGSQRILDVSMKAIEAEIRRVAQGDKPLRRSRSKRKRGR